MRRVEIPTGPYPLRPPPSFAEKTEWSQETLGWTRTTHLVSPPHRPLPNPPTRRVAYGCHQTYSHHYGCVHFYHGYSTDWYTTSTGCVSRSRSSFPCRYHGDFVQSITTRLPLSSHVLRPGVSRSLSPVGSQEYGRSRPDLGRRTGPDRQGCSLRVSR